jgi:RHS repeat-associated protein
VVTFNNTGLETSVADRFGNTTNYAWVFNSDAGKNVLATITDPSTQVTSFVYRNNTNASGYKLGTLAAITTPGNRSASFGVPASNDLQVVAEPDGGWFAALGYDTQHRLTSVQDKNGGITNFTYAYDKTLSYVDAPSVVLATGASARPRTAVREAYSGLYSAVAAGGGASTSNAIPVPAFDIRTAVTDPLGRSIFYSLNRFGSPQKTYAPLAPADSAEYIDSTGQVTRTLSGTGHDVRYVWKADQLVKVVDVTAGKSDSIHYDVYAPYTLPDHMIGSSGEQWFLYDSLKPGWPLKTTILGPWGTPGTTHFPDATGRDTLVTDPIGHRTAIVYATTGFRNRTSVRTPNEQSTTFTYDAYGRPATSTDPYGVTSSQQLDVLNRVTWSTATSGNDTTRFYYDALNADTLVVDGKGQSYHTARNALGWVVKQVDPANAADSVAYDSAGQVVFSRSRAGRVVTFLYDAAGRVTRQSSPARSDAIIYSYDANGKWVAAQSIVANVVVSTDTTFTDEAAHADTTRTWRPGVRSWRLLHTYNPSDPGLSTALLQTPATGDTTLASTVYTYDASKRLSAIRTLTDTTSFAYNNDNLLVADTLRSGLVETRAYTSSHVLSDRSYAGASVVDSLLGRWYRSDSLARLVQRGDTTQYQNFGYDASGRLNSWVKKARGLGTLHCENQDGWGYVCGGTIDTTKLTVLPTYDAVGNPADLGATLNAGNRLRVFNNVTMTYDADGFMVKRQTSTTTDSLVWDDFGQLVKVIRSAPTSVTTTFAYDGFGRRITKVFGATTVRYLWDGDQLVAETNANGSIAQTYSYYPGVDQPRSVTVGTQTYLMSTEPDGTVNGLIKKSDKSVAAQYAYTPWGELETNVDSIGGVRVNSLRWKGLLYDKETGLYYMRARYYDPTTRRFISEDPIGLEGGINAYAFGSSDPVNRSDPSGLSDNGFTGCWVLAETIQYRNYFTGEWTSEPIPLYVETMCPTEPVGPGMGGDTPPSPPGQNAPPHPSGPSSGPTGPSSAPTGIWTYGNWCSFGGGGVPINATDAACMAHDQCYGRHRFSAISNFTGHNNVLQACNQLLCNAVRARAAELTLQAYNMVQSPLPFLRAPRRYYSAEYIAAIEINAYFTYGIAIGGSACHSQ